MAEPQWTFDFNGPSETGLSAASKDAIDAKWTLKVFASITNSLRSVAPVDNVDEPVARTCAIATILVLHNKWYMAGGIPDGNVKIMDFADAGPAANAKFMGKIIIDKTFSDGITDGDKSKATLLIASCKVNWFLTNHSVGQGNPTDFIKKVFQQTFPANVTPTVGNIKAIWIIGHFASTKAILHGLGVKNITNVKVGDEALDPVNLPKASDDFKKRLESGPAGTASVFTYKAIVKIAAESALSICLPANEDYAKIMQVRDVGADARYHEGAEYLTGAAKLTLFEISEEAKVHLSSFIHASNPKSSLAKAKVIKKSDEVNNTDVYNKIAGIVNEIKMNGGNEVVKARVLGILGSDVGGDPFANARAIAGLQPRALKDVDEIMKDIEQAEAAGLGKRRRGNELSEKAST